MEKKDTENNRRAEDNVLFEINTQHDSTKTDASQAVGARGPRNTSLLKILVVSMGVILLLGFGLIVLVLVGAIPNKKILRHGEPLGGVEHLLEPGEFVLSYLVRDERLVLCTRNKDVLQEGEGCWRLMVLSLRNGRTVATFKTPPQGP